MLKLSLHYLWIYLSLQFLRWNNCSLDYIPSFSFILLDCGRLVIKNCLLFASKCLFFLRNCYQFNYLQEFLKVSFDILLLLHGFQVKEDLHLEVLKSLFLFDLIRFQSQKYPIYLIVIHLILLAILKTKMLPQWTIVSLIYFHHLYLIHKVAIQFIKQALMIKYLDRNLIKSCNPPLVTYNFQLNMITYLEDPILFLSPSALLM